MILLVSFNLRTPMTSVGPVMDLIQTEYGMSAGMAGLITTLPLIMFGVASPFVPAVNRRLGYSRTMCIAIASIIAGELLRNLMGLTGLFAGTALIGIGIGIGKDDFLYKANAEYRGILDRIGAEYTYYETGEGHIWRNWRIYLSEFVQLLFK